MLTGNLLIVFAIMGIITILLIIQFILAARNDHEISAAPRYKTLEVLDEEIQLKKEITSDLEEELDKRRQKLEVVADLGHQVEMLERKRDELTTEWEQLEERRNEVHQVRSEMEETINEKLHLDSELAEIRKEWESLKERSFEAEQLVAKIDEMQQEHNDLKTFLDEHKDEARELSEARDLIEDLNRQAGRLRDEISNHETEIRAASQLVADMSARTEAERKELVTAQAEHTEVAAKAATAHQNVLELEATCAALEARRARLEEETEGVTATDPDAEVKERLKELTSCPPVLKNIQHWQTAPLQSEAAALNGVFQRLESSGLEYHRRIIYAFHTAMKVNETTQMAVLAGISGTGKSQLPRQYASGMGIGFLQVPVQPRWDSPQDLMGFYNYIEKRFRPTDMARALYQLDSINNPDSEFRDRMMMILLDEMNLARVEYYFSDFLSRLESRPPANQVSNDNLRKDAEIELEIPMPKGVDAPRIFPGYNLLFAGTMNEDESTQSLSDKVVDRANVLRFAAPRRIHSGNTHTENPSEPQALTKSQWDQWVKNETNIYNPQINNALDNMVHIMKDFKRPFGHRLGRAISVYVENYPIVEGGNQVLDPLADQVEMRLLPKLRGIEIDQAEQAFDALVGLTESTLW